MLLPRFSTDEPIKRFPTYPSEVAVAFSRSRNLRLFKEFWTSAWFLSIFSISIYSPVFFPSLFLPLSTLGLLEHALVHEIQAQIARPRRGWRCRKGSAAYLSCLASLSCRFLNFKVDSSIRLKWIIQKCPGTNAVLPRRKLSKQF